MTAPSYYAMTMPGLETLAFSEVRARVPDAELVKFARGIAVFRTAARPGNLMELRTVEDVFVTLAHLTRLGHGRDALHVLHGATLNADLDSALAVWRRAHKVAKPHTWRVVSQKSGSHDFRRLDAGEAVSAAMRRTFSRSMPRVGDGSDPEFWLLVFRRAGLIGVRLCDVS